MARKGGAKAYLGVVNSTLDLCDHACGALPALDVVSHCVASEEVLPPLAEERLVIDRERLADLAIEDKSLVVHGERVHVRRGQIQTTRRYSPSPFGKIGHVRCDVQQGPGLMSIRPPSLQRPRVDPCTLSGCIRDEIDTNDAHVCFSCRSRTIGASWS